MKIDAPFEIELEYVQRMMAWLLFVEPARPWPSRHAMQLGLGAATLTKFSRKKLRMRTTPSSSTRRWSRPAAAGSSCRPTTAEAARGARRCAAEIRKPEWHGTVDALQVDLYDHEAAAPVLDSEAFYADCRGC
jgi:spermidine synthase